MEPGLGRRVFVGTGIASTQDSSGWSLLGGFELVEARRLFLGLEISHDLAKDVLTSSDRSNCFACHQKAAQRDHVFSRLQRE